LAELAFPAAAEVSVREVECRSGGVSLFVQNSGGQPAHLFDPQLALLRDNSRTELDFGLKIPAESVKVEANNVIRLSFDFPEGQTLPTREAGGSCMIAIALKSIDAASEKATTVEENCQCPG